MPLKNRRGRRPAAAAKEAGGFTLVELLVVIGVLSLLVVTFIPAYAANRSGSQAFQCLNNHRQLVRAWMMYPTDNNDRLPYGVPPAAGTMYWTTGSDNTNQVLLVDPEQSALARYVSVPDVWKCPADTVPAANGPRVRSVSLNGAVVGVSCSISGFGFPPGREYHRYILYSHQLRKPSEVFVSMDEHPDSINDSYLVTDVGQPPPLYKWRDLPASYHNGAAGFSAADGRAEMHRWLDDRTRQPIKKAYKWYGSPLFAPNSVDVEWINNMMPYRVVGF